MDTKLMSGTVEMLVLEVANPAPGYGYRITQEVLERSGGHIEMKEGSLYPALHRMERKGLLTSYWVETEEGRRRKYYQITAKGQKALEEKRAEWRRFALGVNGVLGASADALA